MSGGSYRANAIAWRLLSFRPQLAALFLPAFFLRYSYKQSTITADSWYSGSKLVVHTTPQFTHFRYGYGGRSFIRSRIYRVVSVSRGSRVQDRFEAERVSVRVPPPPRMCVCRATFSVSFFLFRCPISIESAWP